MKGLGYWTENCPLGLVVEPVVMVYARKLLRKEVKPEHGGNAYPATCQSLLILDSHLVSFGDRQVLYQEQEQKYSQDIYDSAQSASWPGSTKYNIIGIIRFFQHR